MAKVLVIDDELNVRTPIDMLLSRQGYDVVFADNGWKALQQCWIRALRSDDN